MIFPLTICVCSLCVIVGVIYLWFKFKPRTVQFIRANASSSIFPRAYCSEDDVIYFQNKSYGLWTGTKNFESNFIVELVQSSPGSSRFTPQTFFGKQDDIEIQFQGMNLVIGSTRNFINCPRPYRPSVQRIAFTVTKALNSHVIWFEFELLGQTYALNWSRRETGQTGICNILSLVSSHPIKYRAHRPCRCTPFTSVEGQTWPVFRVGSECLEEFGTSKARMLFDERTNTVILEMDDTTTPESRTNSTDDYI